MEGESRKKFGEIAISLGLLSPEALKKALEYQAKERKLGRNIKLGEVLIKLGYIKKSDAFNIFQEQTILQEEEGKFIGIKFNNIHIIKFLGRGGMGEVYMGENIILKKKVAVKFLSPPLANNSQYVKRFLWEACASSKIDHPNVVQTYDVGTLESTFYIIMQYIEGISLANLIKWERNVEIEKAIDIIHQCTQGLEAAHKLNIIHRDVKPENIMITKEGKVKIMDFGLARALENSQRLTLAGQVMGTPEYISPEACKGEKIDLRTDIYSLGITFYETLTGYPPFYGKAPVSIMVDHISTPPIPPEVYNPQIPDKLSQIILKMISKNPDDRYSTMKQVREELEKVKEAIKNNQVEISTQQKQKREEEKYLKIKKSYSILKKKIKLIKNTNFIIVSFLILILIYFLITHYRDIVLYKKFLKKEKESDNLAQKILCWNEFLKCCSNKYYLFKGLLKLQTIRECCFYKKISEFLKNGKNKEARILYEVYLFLYPTGSYKDKIENILKHYNKSFNRNLIKNIKDTKNIIKFKEKERKIHRNKYNYLKERE